MAIARVVEIHQRPVEPLPTLPPGPADSAKLATMALLKHHAGDIEIARTHTREALALDPRPRLVQAASLLILSDPPMPSADDWIDLPQETAAEAYFEKLFSEAVTAIEMGFLEEAQHRFEELVLIAPVHWESLFELAHLHELQGRISEAMEYYRRAVACGRQAWEPNYNLARLLFAEGGLTEARPLLERALLLEPHSADAASLLGTLCYRLEDLEEATLWFSRAAQIASDRPAIFEQLAQIALLDHRVDDAALWFAKAHRLNPRCPDTAFNVAVCLARLGKFDEALTLWMAHGDHQPSVLAAAALHSAIAAREAAAGDVQSAIAHYRASVTFDPDRANTWIGLGLLLAKSGDLAKATEAFLHALEIDPLTARGYF